MATSQTEETTDNKPDSAESVTVQESGGEKSEPQEATAAEAPVKEAAAEQGAEETQEQKAADDKTDSKGSGSAQETELESQVVELSAEAFKAFCNDISAMFGMGMKCNPQKSTTETIESLKERFKNLVAVNCVKVDGALEGTFQIIFSREGLFTLAGAITMPAQMTSLLEKCVGPEKIKKNIKSGSLKDAEEVSDTIAEAGNLLVGSWDRIFREGLEGHGHLVQTNTFIGEPWDNPKEKIDLAGDEGLTFVPCEITISSYPPFICGAIYQETLFDKAKAEEKIKAEAEAKVRAEAEAKAKAEAEEKAKAEAEEKGKAEVEAKAKAEADEKAKAAEKVKAESELRAKAEAQARAKIEAEEKAKAETEAETKAETEEKAEAETKTKTETAEEPKAEAKEKAEVAEEKPDKSGQTEAKVEAEEKAEAEDKAEEKAEAEIEAKPESEAEAEVVEEKPDKSGEAEAKVEAEEKAEAEIEAKPEGEAKAEVVEEKPDKSGEAEAKVETEEKAEAEDKAEEKAEAEIEAKPEGEAKAEVAEEKSDKSGQAGAKVEAEEKAEAEEKTSVPDQSQESAKGGVSETIQKMTQSPAVLPGESGQPTMGNPQDGNPVHISVSSGVCAKDIMQKETVWANSEESVQQALTKMQQQDSGYIMIGQDGTLEGIVSKSDITGATSIYLRPIFAKWHSSLDDATLQIKLKWIMSRPVRTVRPETPLATIVENMCRFGGRGLPVMDEQGKVQGLVTVFDIFRTLLNTSENVSVVGKTAETPALA